MQGQPREDRGRRRCLPATEGGLGDTDLPTPGSRPSSLQKPRTYVSVVDATGLALSRGGPADQRRWAGGLSSPGLRETPPWDPPGTPCGHRGWRWHTRAILLFEPSAGRPQDRVGQWNVATGTSRGSQAQKPRGFHQLSWDTPSGNPGTIQEEPEPRREATWRLRGQQPPPNPQPTASISRGHVSSPRGHPAQSSLQVTAAQPTAYCNRA